MSKGQNIISVLQNRFPGQITDVQEKVQLKYYVTVDKDIIVDVIKYIKNEGGRFVISTGTDVRESRKGFLVTHIFSLDTEKTFLLINTFLDAKKPKIKSITPVIQGAS